jgi:hypothetical protein
MSFRFYRSIELYTIFNLFRSRAWYRLFYFGLFACLYLATLAAGFQGIANGFGWFWAVVAVIAAMGFRLNLPLVVATYIYAMNDWGWSMAMAAMFATGPQILLWIEQHFSHDTLLKSSWPRELCWILVGCLLIPLFLVKLVAGFEGIENGVGFYWAVLAVAALGLIRFDLPLVVGAYFHATNAWSWHPAMAVLFAIALDICVLIRQYLLPGMQRIGR